MNVFIILTHICLFIHIHTWSLQDKRRKRHQKIVFFWERSKSSHNFLLPYPPPPPPPKKSKTSRQEKVKFIVSPLLITFRHWACSNLHGCCSC